MQIFRTNTENEHVKLKKFLHKNLLDEKRELRYNLFTV